MQEKKLVWLFVIRYCFTENLKAAQDLIGAAARPDDTLSL